MRARRPSPTPQPQARLDLPPLGVEMFDDDGGRIQCHVCGGWFRRLGGHTQKHGLTGQEYRALYQLDRGAALAAPQFSAAQRAAAIRRDQAARLVGARPPQRPLARKDRPASLQTRLMISAHEAGRPKSAETRAALRRAALVRRRAND